MKKINENGEQLEFDLFRKLFFLARKNELNFYSNDENYKVKLSVYGNKFCGILMRNISKLQNEEDWRVCSSKENFYFEEDDEEKTLYRMRELIAPMGFDMLNVIIETNEKPIIATFAFKEMEMEG